MTYNAPLLFENIEGLLKTKPRISLGEISRTVGVERHTIEKIIRRFAKMSFRQYQSIRAMHEASILLRNFDLEVGEVARILGYGSTQAFSRAFKAQDGVNPSQHRRKLNRRRKPALRLEQKDIEFIEKACSLLNFRSKGEYIRAAVLEKIRTDKKRIREMKRR